MRVKVDIIGVINDCKFTAAGGGLIDSRSGDAQLELRYSDCPSGWSPLNYSDPLVLLAAYGEQAGGKNFMSLAAGGFEAESTIDFGGGMALRRTARIRVEGDSLIAVYSIVGVARIGSINNIRPYEEYLMPAGAGQIIGVGLATWGTSGEDLEALISTRYRFNETKENLTRPQVRGFEVDANLSDDNLVYKAKYKTFVRPMTV